jgi:hypothetical protein
MDDNIESLKARIAALENLTLTIVRALWVATPAVADAMWGQISLLRDAGAASGLLPHDASEALERLLTQLQIEPQQKQ